MILILDNNEYRRHDIMMSLFMKKYIVADQPIEYMDFYTKPFLTVYVNPTTEQLKKIKNEDTVCIVAKNRMTIVPPPWMRVIPLDKNVAKTVMQIYDELCPYGKGRDVIGIIGIEGKKFTIGGAYVNLTPKQMKAVKVLLYNRDKKFQLYDISSYLDFNTDPERGFILMVDDVNSKCRNSGRESLIKWKDNYYFISPDVAYY